MSMDELCSVWIAGAINVITFLSSDVNNSVTWAPPAIKIDVTYIFSIMYNINSRGIAGDDVFHQFYLLLILI